MAKSDLIGDDYERLENSAIVTKLLENGLIQKCVDMQFLKMPLGDKWKQQFKEDF